MDNSNGKGHIGAIAVIGMACRFPGAKNTEEFWRNLRAGVESISFFTDHELMSRGVDPEILSKTGYVKAGGVLENIEMFDAELFGFSSKEAEITDPQHRLFLECAWEAIEDAGYDPSNYGGLIGVFAGAGSHTYFHNLYSKPEILQQVGSYRIMIGNDKDYLPTWVSYKLNLKGPSVAIQTACSTSLVAVHLACQSLLVGECDIALAGGVKINPTRNRGYFYQEGGILSPDGRCRAFDAKAQGTVGGDGVGILALKRLEDAIAERDNIRAVIRGSAVNNDGAMKIGYTAPSVEGQAQVIAEAMAVAGVPADTVSYVEAHGTGTILGDPIEIAALTRAFRSETNHRGYCAVGSVKSNIGHLDAAAGAAGLIKTVLSLEAGELPPSLHYDEANPRIDFEESPFYVNCKLSAWKAVKGVRRAGVSSFGIGGTNAHVIVEEATKVESEEGGREWRIIVQSGRTRQSLERAEERLCECLKETKDVKLADVAYTLQVGRRAMEERRVMICRDVESAIAGLEKRENTWVRERRQEPGERGVVFLFPGQTTQYVGMGRGVYENEPAYREEIDRCSKLTEKLLGFEIREVLYPGREKEEWAKEELEQTRTGQVALYVVEYGLAKMLMDWGIEPELMVGHSLGEYVAATLAGVLRVEEGLKLLATRGKLMQRVREGRMVAVALSEEEAESLLIGGLSVAAVNGPRQVVISGEAGEVEELEKSLKARGVVYKRLKSRWGFHSRMMEEIKEEYEIAVRQVDLRAPERDYLSNVSGRVLSGNEAMDEGYWSRQMVERVQWWESMKQMERTGKKVLMEIGPGAALTRLAQSSGIWSGKVEGVSLLGNEEEDGEGYLEKALGMFWLYGGKIDWKKYHAREKRKRRALPTYPFDHKRYWVAAATRHDQIPGRSDHHREKQNNTDEQIMVQVKTTIPPAAERYDAIMSILKSIVNDLTGIEPDRIDTSLTFFEVGVGSLLLIQASQAIQTKLGVRIPFRLFFDELSTIDALATYLEKELPQDSPVLNRIIRQSSSNSYRTAVQGISEEQANAADRQADGDIQSTAILPAPQSLVGAMSGHNTHNGPAHGDTGDDVKYNIITQQLRIMSQQLELLRSDAAAVRTVNLPGAETSVSIGQTEQPSRSIAINTPSSGAVGSDSHLPPGFMPTATEGEVYIPYQPIRAEKTSGLTSRQQKCLDAFMERYISHTKISRQLTQKYRRFLADPRSSSGFLLLWKDMVYPLVVKSSRGSRIWDVDGNEYVDLTMGFGVHLFGHSPPFIVRALQEQIEQGVQLGPQSYLAGQVAELLCELTGAERAVFCNSGTEAIMAALRVARTVTGRNRIAMFAGSYHGSFDGTLARAFRIDGNPGAAPVAPGVPPKMVEDVLVLDYGSAESLEILKGCLGELAGVLVEPVQSRRPAFQPATYLRELRRLTETAGVPLIFDEVITGFRVDPGGAQSLFGVQADLTTYGKVVGGGMPIGVVAGKAALMDAIDGGGWNYDDGSYPLAQQTFFAGTFCKHPLAMAAAWAVLNHLKTNQREFYGQLNQNAAELADTLNQYFTENDLPVQMEHFGSLFRFSISSKIKYRDLFTYYLIEKGVYAWEGGTRFISAAHTEEDLAFIIDAVKQSCEEMRAGGFLPSARDDIGEGAEFSRDGSVTSKDAQAGRRRKSVFEAPTTSVIKQAWALTQLGDDISCAYHDSITLHLRGRLNLGALRKAIQHIVDRHEAFRATFSPDGERQLIHPSMVIDMPLTDFTGRPEQVNEWAIGEIRQAFDLVNGPLLRIRIARVEDEYHQLILTIHHIVADSISYGIIIKELSKLYPAKCRGEDCELPQPMQLSDYLRLQTDQFQSPDLATDEKYWMEIFDREVTYLNLPEDLPRPKVRSYLGKRCVRIIDTQVCGKLKELSAQQGRTLFMTLLTGFKALLHQLSGQEDIIVGINAASHFSMGNRPFVGYRLNPLVIRSRISPNQKLTDYLSTVKRLVCEAYEHQSYPISGLIKKLKLPRDPAKTPITSIVFNLDQAGAGVKIEGLEVEVVSTHNGGAKVDLAFDILDQNGRLVVNCDYNTDIYTGRTIERWLDHYEALLGAIVDDPEQAIAMLPKPGEAEGPEGGEGEEFQLTKHQLLVWIGQRMNPGAPLYLNAGSVYLQEKVIPELFRQAFRLIVNRSDALRMVIKEREGVPYQMILKRAPFDMSLLDFSEAQDPHESARIWMRDRSRTPQNLETRIFDTALLKTSDSSYYWFLNIHHIIADAAATALTIDYVIRCYRSLLNGGYLESHTLPPYIDYLAYERGLIDSKHYQAAEQHWKEKLMEGPEPIDFYGKRSKKKATTVERRSCDIGRERSQRLRELANDSRVAGLTTDLTLTGIFAAVLCGFLHRLSGNRRVSLGIPFHNRGAKSFRETIGLIMQILPIRVEIDKEDDLTSLVKKINVEYLRALRHRIYVVGNPVENPAYEVECNFITATIPSLKDQSAKIDWIHPGFGREPLAVRVHDFTSSGSYTIEFDFNCDVFSERERENAIGHFLRTMDVFLQCPTLPLRSVELVSEQERRYLIERLNLTTRPYLTDRAFQQLFEAQVERQPDQIAASFKGLSVSYALLNISASRIAGRLMELGIGPESIVALYGRRSIEYLTAVLAVFKAGGAYLPLDPEYPAVRARRVLERSQSRLILCDEALAENLSATLGTMPEKERPQVRTIEELSRGEEETPGKNAVGDGRNLSYVIYTSGSTGTPKGAMNEYRGMINHLYAMIEELSLTREDVMAQTASSSFDISVWQFLAPLLVGGRVEILGDEDVKDPVRLTAEVTRHKVTVLELVPSMLRAVEERLKEGELCGLRWMLVAGEAVSPELCQEWERLRPQVKLVNAYGPAECSDDVTLYEVKSEENREVVGIGRPVGNTRIYILDEERRPTPMGVVGEICVGGVEVGRGYLNEAAITAQSFIPAVYGEEAGERMYLTGDLGRYREDGVIEYQGRLDEQEKISGYRIEKEEIESVIKEDERVKEAVVVARELEGIGKRLVGYVVLKEGEEVKGEEIRERLKEHLPAYMLPARVVLLERMPLTANGKLDRKALPLVAVVENDSETKPVAAVTPMEKKLVEIWEQVLGLERIGVHDNFFDLGGDSINAIQVASKANQEGLRLSPLQIFQHQTIAELAKEIDVDAEGRNIAEAEKTKHSSEVDFAELNWSQAEVEEITATISQYKDKGRK
jgi:amino acid adenylation domain-containing protein